MRGQLSRRGIVKLGAALALAGGGVGCASAREKRGQIRPKDPGTRGVGDLSAPALQVPDTLDLAERASLALNALTEAADCEKANCETYHVAHLDHRPAYMTHR